MKDRFAATGAAVLKGAVETLLFLPLLTIIAAYALPAGAAVWWLAVLPLAYAAGCAGKLWLPLRRLYRSVLFAIAVSAVWSFAFFGLSLPFAFSAVIVFIAVMRGGRMAEEDWMAQFSLAWYGAGLLTYFLLSVFAPLLPKTAPYGGALNAFGLLAIVVSLFRINLFNMRAETLSGSADALPAAVRRHNRLLVTLALVVIAALMFFSHIREGWEWLRERLIAMLQALFSRSGPSEAPPLQQPEQGMTPLLPQDDGQRSVLLEWLEQIVVFLLYAAAIVGLIYLLYKLGRKLPSALRKWMAWLLRLLRRERAVTVDPGYEDEVESLDRERSGGGLFRFVKRAEGTADKWPEAGTNADKVRFLYREWLRRAMRKGYPLRPHLTPGETAEDIAAWQRNAEREAAGGNAGAAPLVTAYEAVRYGGKTVSDAEVEAIREKLELDVK